MLDILSGNEIKWIRIFLSNEIPNGCSLIFSQWAFKRKVLLCYCLELSHFFNRERYHLNNSGRAKATIWWNAWCSERREGKTSKSMRMFLLVDIASEFARRGDAVHVVAPQEAAR